jgi:hypothetical protein
MGETAIVPIDVFFVLFFVSSVFVVAFSGSRNVFLPAVNQAARRPL